MIFSFNSKGLYEEPTILLCYPNLVEHVYLSFFKGLKITPRFNAVSEISCSVYEKYMDDQTHKWVDVPCYELIKKNKVLHILGFGYFIITQATENMDGTVNTKQVTAYSYEFTLNKRYANLQDDTYRFYDPVDNSDTLLGKLITLFPSWTIGHVDSELWTLKRTFSGVNGSKTYYQFLMTDVEEAYGCIFKFDIENMTINAYTPNNSVSETDIILSFDSTVKDITIAEDDSTIKTALYVAGSGDLTINNVNPLGTAYIYDFRYYKSPEWMDQDLIDALTAWENKLASYQETYSEKLTSLKDLNAELIVLNEQLTALDGELKDIDKARTEEYPNVQASTTASYNAKLAEITAKQAEIDAKNNQIKNVTSELTVINDAVSFANNFTELQLSQLDRLIDEDTYINDTYEITDSMTNVEIMELTQQLYEAGLEQLKQVSQPCYTFSMNTVNFLFIKKFLPFIQQVKMGCKIYVDTDKVWYNPLLLEMVIDYDEPQNFTMTFGNRFRLMDQTWSVTELLGSVQSTTSSVSSNSSLWTNGAKAGNLFTEYKNSTLNAANQAIVNSEKQSITIDQAGIRSRKLLEDGSYDPVQSWINNGLYCITDDNWQSTKVAIGIINGQASVNAEVIGGNMLVGGGLKIYTANNDFIVDENGVKLINADFLMQTKETSGRIKNQILLNPDTGFKIQSNTTSGTGTPVYKDIFYLASDGSGIEMQGSIVTFGSTTSEDVTYDTATKLASGGLWFYRKLPSQTWDLSTSGTNAQRLANMQMFGDDLVINGNLTIMNGKTIKVENLYGNTELRWWGKTVYGADSIMAKDLRGETCMTTTGQFLELYVGYSRLSLNTLNYLTGVSVSRATCSVSGYVPEIGANVSLTGDCDITLNTSSWSTNYWGI